MTQSTMNTTRPAPAPPADLVREYAEVLGRHDKPRPMDGKRLGIMLPVLGKDKDDVTMDLLIIAEARRLASEADGMDSVKKEISEGESQLGKIVNALAVATDKHKIFDLEDQDAEQRQKLKELESKLMNMIQASVSLASLRNKYLGLLEPLIPWKAEWGSSHVAANETSTIYNSRRELEKRRRLAALTPERRAAEKAFYTW